jgi:hypothetical protein
MGYFMWFDLGRVQAGGSEISCGTLIYPFHRSSSFFFFIIFIHYSLDVLYDSYASNGLINHAKGMCGLKAYRFLKSEIISSMILGGFLGSTCIVVIGMSENVPPAFSTRG